VLEKLICINPQMITGKIIDDSVLSFICNVFVIVLLHPGEQGSYTCMAHGSFPLDTYA